MIHRYVRLLLASLLLVAGISVPLHAQGEFWSPTEGPFGGDIRALAIDSHGRTFAGLFSVGIFRSIDNGASWTDVSGGLGDLNVLAVAADSADNLFAGTATAGLYRSTDNGGSWNPANVGLVSSTVYDIVFDAAGRILLGTNQGLFASTDGGEVWGRIGEGLPRSDAQRVVIDSAGRIFVAVIGQGVYLSADSGASFTQSNTGLGNGPFIYALAVAPDGTLFASNGLFGLYRSTDHAASWNRVGLGVVSKSIGALLIDSLGIVYAGSLFDSVGTVFRSTDRGESWSRIDSGLASQNVRALAMNRGGEILAGTASGAFRLDAARKGWTEINAGLRGMSVIALATAASGELFAGAVSGGIYRSSDNGASWRRSGAGLNDIYTIQTLVAGRNGDLFAGTANQGVYRSTDNGGHWSKDPAGLDDGSGVGSSSIPSIAVDSSGALLAAVPGQGVFRSTDNGSTWKIVRGPETLANPFTVAAVAVDSAGRFLAGTAEGDVYRYPDSLGNWRLLDSSRAGLAIRSLAVDARGRVFAATAVGLYRWSDSLSGWTRRDTGVLYPDFYTMIINPTGYVYAGGRSGVYRSTDSGVSFVNTGDGLPGFPVRSLAIGRDDILFAGTAGRGVYRSVQTSGAEEPARRAGGFAMLDGNVPNPFASSTRIGFTLPEAGRARLLLHDLNGREVAVLADGLMSAGAHEIVVEGSALQAGVYFYTLEAGGMSRSRTMVVLR